jgi:tetratricopeptide (TPR) repeat protein
MDPRIADIRKRVAADGAATPEDIDQIDDLLEAEGPSVDLLILRGQLIQLLPDDDPAVMDEAFACYQEAVELDPSSAEANEEIAHFLDDVADEPEEAEPYFRRAIALGAGETAREGLREVLSQLGRSEE